MAKASRPVPEPAELIKLALAVKANARSWLSDAATMIQKKRWPRAYSFSTLALEEYGKAALCLGFSTTPREGYSAAVFWELLNGHLAKLLMAYQFALFMQPDGLREAMLALGRVVEDTNEAKKQGLYADFDSEGRVREPSVIDQATAQKQVRAVRKILNARTPLNDASFLEWLAGPEDDLKKELAEWTKAYITAMTQVYEQDGEDGLLAFFGDQLQGMQNDRWATPGEHREALEAALTTRAAAEVDN
jgi:AbiV family abortive infection protein